MPRPDPLNPKRRISLNTTDTQENVSPKQAAILLRKNAPPGPETEQQIADLMARGVAQAARNGRRR